MWPTCIAFACADWYWRHAGPWHTRSAGTTLYAKLPHSYGSEQGDVLGTGALTVRRVTRYQADLAGLSTADVAEDVSVGEATAVVATNAPA